VAGGGGAAAGRRPGPVAAILANPRYTGRQVWNRQFTDHREATPGDRRSSLGPVRI
jgi:hypothetical protein